jgi:glycine cleavage system protein P-like pyridoxal-binding family
MKSAIVCGLGKNAVVEVKCDRKGRMRVDDLQIKIEECLANK